MNLDGSKRLCVSNWSVSMAEWRAMTLGEMAAESGGGIQTGPFGSQLHADDYVLDGIPVVMPQNIGDNRIVETGIARISPSDRARLDRYVLKAGDIVYSRRGDVERRALVREENDGWLCGTGCLRVRMGCQNVHDSRFVSYALGLPEPRKWIVRHAVGATMLNLNTSILGDVPLCAPTIHEQRAIAEVLGALDDKITANGRLAMLTREMLSARFLAMKVDVWPHEDGRVLSDLIELNPTLRLAAGETRPYLDMKNLPQGAITASTWSHRESKGGARFQNGDTLLARITPCLENGKAGYVDFLHDGEVGIGSTEFIVMRPKPMVPNALPYFLAISDRFREYAIRHMMGSTGRQRLAAADLAGYPLCVPPPSQLLEFQAISDPLLARLKGAVDESRTLAATRDQLLPLLMSGRLRVRDAERAVEEVV